MARVRHIQNHFSSGEFSPLLRGRTDFAKYDSAVEELINFIPRKYGGAFGRNGLRYVAEVKDSSKKVRLINFEFNTSQQYIIEMGDLYFRFYRNNSRIESPPGTPVEIVTPYLEAELFDIQFAQSNDIMWLTHPNHKTKKLTRTSDIAWTLTDYTPTSDPFPSPTFFPSCVAFWQERLWFSATLNNPRRIWSTKSGDFEDMSIGTGQDDEAIIVDPASGQQNVIEWLSPTRVLLYGTAGDENQLRASSIAQAVTPSNRNSVPETNFGSASFQPVRAQSATLFIQRARRKIRELVFSFDVDGYVANDLTELSEHLLPKGKSATQLSYEKEPNSLVWTVRSDGVLLSMTYEKSQDVFGWAQQKTWTENGTVLSPIESSASILHPDGDRDQTWLAVNRVIGGQTKRYVEYFDDELNLDSALSYSGVATTTLTGLDHLEGQLVQIVSEGSVKPAETVSGGQVELEDAVTEADVGLYFTPRMKSLPPEFNVGSGTAQGTKKRWSNLTLRINETTKQGVQVNGDFIAGRDPETIMGTAPQPVSEDIDIKIEDGWGLDGTFVIEQVLPLPVEILAYFGTIEGTDS